MFKTWDRDGGGTVSRKEFRLWWPKIGYEAPVEDLNALFDEFDVDGSGEIDEDEFKNAYEQRGHLWRKLEELKRQHDEGDAVQRQIDELRAKVSRKTTARQVELDAMAKQREGIAERASHADRIREEMKGLTENLDAREARLRAFKGGIKEMMVLNSVVRAFQMTPDDAATKVQAAVRGKNARKGSGGKGEPKMSSKRTPSHAQATARLRGMPEHGLVPAPAPVAAPRPPPAPAVPIVKKISATEAVEPKFADDFNTALRHWQTHLQKVQPPRAKRPPKDLAAAAKSLVASSAPARVMPSGIHAALAASALKAATRADDGGM